MESRNNIVSSQQGVGIIEAILALLISAIVVVFCFSMMVNNRFQKPREETLAILRNLLLLNAIEVNGATFSQLPAVGQCKLRIYDLKGTFVSEANYTSSAVACNQPTPLPNQVYVYWIVLPQTSINATFTPSTFLQLPSYVNVIDKIQIGIMSLSNGPRSPVFTKQMTITKGVQ